MRSDDSRLIHRRFFRFFNYLVKFRASDADCFLSKHSIFLLKPLEKGARKEEREVEKSNNSYPIHRRFFRSCDYVVKFNSSDEIAFFKRLSVNVYLSIIFPACFVKAREE